MLPVIKSSSQQVVRGLRDNVLIEGPGVSNSVSLGIPAKFSIKFGDAIPVPTEEVQLVFQDEAGNVVTEVEYQIFGQNVNSEDGMSPSATQFEVTYVPYQPGKLYLQAFAGDKRLSEFPFLVNVVNPRTLRSLFFLLKSTNSDAFPCLLLSNWTRHDKCCVGPTIGCRSCSTRRVQKLCRRIC